MSNDTRSFRTDTEEDFAKEIPTRDPNPDNLLFLQGYEGEMYRELVTAASDTVDDSENILLWVDQEESLSPEVKDRITKSRE